MWKYFWPFSYLFLESSLNWRDKSFLSLYFHVKTRRSYRQPTLWPYRQPCTHTECWRSILGRYLWFVFVLDCVECGVPVSLGPVGSGWKLGVADAVGIVAAWFGSASNRLNRFYESLTAQTISPSEKLKIDANIKIAISELRVQQNRSS